MEISFGLTDNVLAWYRSYLSERTQSVSLVGQRSDPVSLECGLPQGSKIGPRAYTQYTKPLGLILILLLILYHFYADDSQVFKSADPKSIDSQRSSANLLERAINTAGSWMTANRLKLNQDKTEFIVFASRYNENRIAVDSLNLSGETIKRVPKAKNLGVILDSELSFVPQIANICKSCMFNIRAIWKVRRYLTVDITKQIVHSLVISKLDYCNSLLYGLPASYIARLQRVQNAAARLITLCPRREHITPHLKSLHWLPIIQRVEYKLITLTFKSVHGLAPTYLSDLITTYVPSRQLRSANQGLLNVPSYNLKGYGFRSFRVAGPTLWNSLPPYLRSETDLPKFQKLLKCHLFRTAYNI